MNKAAVKLIWMSKICIEKFMSLTRRQLFTVSVSIAVLAVAAPYLLRQKRTQPLLTDPDEQRFHYVDGWIVER